MGRDKLVPRPGEVVKGLFLQKSMLLMYLDKATREARAQGSGQGPLTSALLVWCMRSMLEMCKMA